MKLAGWTKTREGYTWGAVTLTKRGTRWVLTAPGHPAIDLGRRASFDTAERKLAQLGINP